MKLIVGLGNPGPKYKATRHNIGFSVVSRLAKKHRIRISRLRSQAKTGAGKIKGNEVLLCLPQTFMNLSGEAVGPLFKSRNISLEDLLVVCDDINLNFGALRIKNGGGAGGHNGLKSLTEHLGTQDFARLRIGVGRDGLKGDMTGFVLGRFTRKEQESKNDLIALAAQACEDWICRGAQKTADKYNVRNPW